MRYDYRSALIVGAGSGLSASLARIFHREGRMRIGLAARDVGKLHPLALETDGVVYPCDATKPDDVDALFESMDHALGGMPEVVVYNASARARGPFIQLDRKTVAQALAVTAYGGFLVAQAAARRMLGRKRGAIIFTGASASLKGFAQSAPFAMGKFALRGLAQSLARELTPQGIHIAHVVIDGAIRSPGHAEPNDEQDSMLDPDAIARAYLDILHQDRSAWTWEIELRPWVERF